MGPYKNIVYHVNYRGFNRKRQIVDQVLNDLHTMQMDCIEAAVEIKEKQGFPEAAQVINHVRGLS
jgi:hypothetical protein